MPGFSEEHRIAASNLIGAIESQRDLMIDVATGGARIQEVNDTYKQRRDAIRRRLQELGIHDDPNPFQDLWEWYHRWSNGDLPTYRDRRAFLRELYSPLMRQLSDIESGADELHEPTGWARVDRVVEKMLAQLARARAEEDYQTVGLLGREVIISLSQAVFDPTRHRSTDGVDPSDTDAGRMLDGYIAAEMAGSSNEQIRRHAKASLALALALQHRRTASFRMAALCCEATRSVVNIIAVMSGLRDPATDSRDA
jgi:AcrR family transcriptional regulator